MASGMQQQQQQRPPSTMSPMSMAQSPAHTMSPIHTMSPGTMSPAQMSPGHMFPRQGSPQPMMPGKLFLKLYSLQQQKMFFQYYIFLQLYHCFTINPLPLKRY